MPFILTCDYCHATVLRATCSTLAAPTVKSHHKLQLVRPGWHHRWATVCAGHSGHIAELLKKGYWIVKTHTRP